MLGIKDVGKVRQCRRVVIGKDGDDPACDDCGRRIGGRLVIVGRPVVDAVATARVHGCDCLFAIDIIGVVC